MNKSLNSSRRRYQSKMPITDKNIGKNYYRGTEFTDGQPNMAKRNKVKMEQGLKLPTEIKVTPRPENSFQGWPFAGPPRGMRLAHRTGQRPHFAKKAKVKHVET